MLTGHTIYEGLLNGLWGAPHMGNSNVVVFGRCLRLTLEKERFVCSLAYSNEVDGGHVVER